MLLSFIPIFKLKLFYLYRQIYLLGIKILELEKTIVFNKHYNFKNT